MPIDNINNENELLLRIANGDEAAFREVFTRLKDDVYRTAVFFAQSNELAEEIVQDVFLSLWIKRQNLSEIKDFKSYVFIITRNAVYRGLRTIAAQQLQQQEFVAEYRSGVHHESAAILLDKRYEALLSEAVNRLPQQQREVYTLIKEDGLTREEAARQLTLSPETVKRHLSLATKSIRAFCLKHIYLVLAAASWL